MKLNQHGVYAVKKKIMLTLLALTISESSLADVSIKINPNSPTSYTGQYVNVLSDYEVKVHNATSTTQSYLYKASLCPALNKCELKTRNFNVLPNDTFSDLFRLGVSVRYNRAEVFQSKATVEVEGAEKSQKTAVGNVTVYQR